MQRILAEQPLHSGKVRYYLERRDPDFEAKMREILPVYREVWLKNQNHGGVAPVVVTISADGKPGLQAIANTAPDPPPVPWQTAHGGARPRIQAPGNLLASSGAGHRLKACIYANTAVSKRGKQTRRGCSCAPLWRRQWALSLGLSACPTKDSHLIFAGKLHLLADDADRLIYELIGRGCAIDANKTFADLKDTQPLTGRIIGYQRLIASVSIPGVSDNLRKYQLHDAGKVLDLVEILKDHVGMLNDKAAEEVRPYLEALSGK